MDLLSFHASNPFLGYRLHKPVSDWLEMSPYRITAQNNLPKSKVILKFWGILLNLGIKKRKGETNDTAIVIKQFKYSLRNLRSWVFQVLWHFKGTHIGYCFYIFEIIY